MNGLYEGHGNPGWPEPPCFEGWRVFGAHSRVHTAKVLRLSSDLPIVIEIVDTFEKIEQFMPIIDGAIQEGLATLENATIRFYRDGK